MGIWAISHGSPMQLYRTWSRALCRPTSVRSSEVSPLPSSPLPSVLSDDNYTDMGQTMQPSWPSSQGMQGILVIEKTSVEYRRLSLPRTITAPMLGLKANSSHQALLCSWTSQSCACTRRPGSPSCSVFNSGNLEGLPSFHVRRPSMRWYPVP